MKSLPKHLISFSFLVLAAFGLCSEAHAIFNLQASPRKGGQGIRFEESVPGKLLQNEEVAFTITSTEGTQYNVYQTMYQPLTNEMGNVIPPGAFILFSPSNPSGTLRTQQESPLSMGQTPIYTSNAGGESDQFVLVYNVRVPENQPGGTYRTTITYTADPVNPSGGVSPSMVTLDVTVELRPTFQITVQNLKGGQQELNLGRIAQNSLTAKSTLRVRIDSNIGTTYRIVQQLADPLSSPDGETLEDGDLVFQVAGGSGGRVEAGSAQPLGQAPQAVYTSDDSGQGGTFEMQYEATPATEQKAGIYSGTLTFKVESNSPLVSPEIITVPVRLEIDPIFYLDVQMAQGTALHFGTFKTSKDEQTQTSVVTVYSNIGEPYTVSQTVKRLTNPTGAVIPDGYFRYFGADAKSGTLSATAPTPLGDGETIVFKSNSKGSPEKFVLNYLLSVPADARGGSYDSDIKYSITTL
jgi:hypothetical protein